MAIVGEQFPDYVVKQINLRQSTHGKETRSIEDLQYLNSKTAWVKLASGVSLKGKERIEELGWNGIGESMDLAKKYVLFGGTSFKPNDSTVLQQLEGFKTNQVWRNAYNVNAKQQKENLDFGFVPPPGIESIDIKNMNRGSIKKATVKIKAYSRDQFDILDILYMRLGYTVLLEWGWSHYLSNTSGKVEPMGYTLVEAKKGFFSDDAKSHQQFLNKIALYRKDKSGSYDGLLAKVSNFDWTFNSDGSYDINLTLISLGDVVESLKTNVSPRLVDGEIEGDNKPKDILSEYLFLWKTANTGESSKSIFYYLDNSPKKIGYFVTPPKNQIISDTFRSEDYGFSSQLFNSDKIFDDAKLSLQELKSQNKRIKKIKLYGLDFLTNGVEISQFTSDVSPTIVQDGGFSWVDQWFEIDWELQFTGDITNVNDIIYFQYSSDVDPENPTPNSNDNLGYYMRLGHLLEKVKEYCLPVNSNNPDEKIVDIQTSGGDMLYYPNQISFDPRVCVVKGEINNNKIFPQLKQWGREETGTARTMNIYVNFTTIQNAIDGNLDENGDLSLISFLQSICTELNKALGGVNNLEPIVDEDNNTILIIDGSLLSDDIEKREYGLEVFGYNPGFNSSNFVRNIDLKTQITPEYASMVTIGATAGGYVKGTEATMFSKWNKGLIDRFKEKYNPPQIQGSTESNIDEPNVNYIKYLESKDAILGYSGGSGNFTLLGDTIDGNLSIVKEYYKYLNYIAQEKDPKFSSTINGFIPFNLGVTMDGISGMKIYNKLNVSTRFLPTNYPESLHFIIKGVSHKVSNQDWETSLETTVVPNSVVSNPQ